LDWEQQESIDDIAVTLLHIYVNCSDRIAKHLRSVIGELPVSDHTIRHMADLDNGEVRNRLRIYKLYRKFFDEVEDDLFVDLSEQLAEATINLL